MLEGAGLLCEATPSNAQAWPIETLHLFGAPIVPGATYEVRMCDATGATCSDPLTVATSKWGDVVAPFGGEAQPDFGDIGGIVDKFKILASAPDIVRTDLRGQSGRAVDATADFADIGADVDAFKGFAYPFTVPACP